MSVQLTAEDGCILARGIVGQFRLLWPSERCCCDPYGCTLGPASQACSHPYNPAPAPVDSSSYRYALATRDGGVVVEVETFLITNGGVVTHTSSLQEYLFLPSRLYFQVLILQASRYSK